jgi:LysM repeat protein
MNKIRLFLLFAVFTVLVIPNTRSFSAAASPYDLLAVINSIRAANGLEPVSSDPILMSVAQNHATYISQNPGAGHFDANGGQERDRAEAAGFSVTAAGGWIDECWAAARNDTPVETMVYNSWSDFDHWYQITNPGAKFAGAGVVESDGMTYYILNLAGSYDGASHTGGAASTIPSTAVTVQVAPMKLATPEADGSIIHTVSIGQAPWSIAAAYDITVDQLIALNSLGTNPVIFEGQKLIIQPGYTPTPSPTATLTPRPPTRTPIPAQTAQPVATQESTGSGSIFNMNRSTMGLVLVLICGAGLALMVIGTVKREKPTAKKSDNKEDVTKEDIEQL